MKLVSCLLFGLVFCISVAFSVDTSAMESLRMRSQSSGSQLSDSDITQISDFWDAAMDEMLLAESSLELVDIRRQVEGVKGTDNLSYFSTAYVSQAMKSIQVAFENSARFDDPVQKDLVQRNLLILAANLKSPKLAPLALERLGSEDDVIRYWAFKTLTQSAMIQQLTSDVTGDEALVDSIFSELKKHMATETQIEIIKMVVNFCMAFDHPQAREILLQIQDQRVKAYNDWSIGDLPPDARLLRALGQVAMVHNDPQVKSDFGRAFSELFALVMQRYMLAVEGNSDHQLEQVQTIIAKVEQDVLKKSMKLKTGFLPAMKTKNTSALKSQYEFLFGDRLRSGQLGTMFKFDYGKDDSGRAVTTPPELAPRPLKIAE